VTSHLALYRRYRPGTFAEVVGQPQVTEPLSRALATDRVGHAYLFSGPRGCGKTTSARILARSLNCEHGPTPTPCGRCRSCVELGPGGPGSVDVVEIDAASHGKVDDTRDLRERAFFAPVAARRKVYIIDEAHMISKEGFNALLKVVEEPPEHLTFVFATTEPDKVLPTIRSRTHHYPFRLIPPTVLTAHLSWVAAQEHLAIEPAALALVVRAGGGSARDALSVLDQLMAGAGPAGITYDEAVALLGYTPEALLDRVVDALAAYDGADVFAAVGQVVDGGQDPRRFAEDLLRRLRDLVVLGAVPGSGAAILLDVPPETVDRLVSQHARFGQAHALRAAELVDAGLTGIRGATAPRLHLELLLARLLLPAADGSEAGFAARLERIERRLAAPQVSAGPAVAASRAMPAVAGSRPMPAADPAAGTDPPTGAPSPVAAVVTMPSGPVEPTPSEEAAAGPASTMPGGVQASDRAAPSEPAAPPDRPTPPDRPAPSDQPAPSEPAARAGTPEEAADPAGRAGARVGEAADPAAPVDPAAGADPRVGEAAALPRPARAGAAAAGSLGLSDLRKLWDDVLDDVKGRSRIAHAALLGSQVVGIDAGRLTVSFANEGMRTNFTRGNRAPTLHAALHALLALDVVIDTVVGAGTVPMAVASGASAGVAPGQPPGSTGGPQRTGSGDRDAGPDTPGPGPGQARGARTQGSTGDSQSSGGSGLDTGAPSADRGGTGGDTDGGRAAGVGQRRDGGAFGPADGSEGTSAGTGPDGWPVAAVPGGSAPDGAPPASSAARHPSPEDEISPDDADLDDPGVSGRELLTRELGAEVITDGVV